MTSLKQRETNSNVDIGMIVEEIKADGTSKYEHSLKPEAETEVAEKPHKCTVCWQSFATNHDLTVHNLVNGGESYECKNLWESLSPQH